jgi:peptidoglycan/xylan/chitin deacetylase (PgdA/CDA1 family)
LATTLPLSRRNVLFGLVAAATAVAFAQYGDVASGQAAKGAGVPPPPAPLAPEWPSLLPPPPRAARVPLPGGAVLSMLPGPADVMALTLDDGVDSGVVRAYAQLAHDSGIRLTVFVTGVYKSWTENRDVLVPLVESGQIQLANHTWAHPNLTKLTERELADDLRHNDQFIKDTFGVDATPYYRPPYGAYNDIVTKVATDLGYTVTTLWNGTLGDDAPLAGRDIVANASKYFTAHNIVIGHLNHPPVTTVYHQLVDLIRERKLRTVTLDDVFTKPEVTRLTSEYPT